MCFCYCCVSIGVNWLGDLVFNLVSFVGGDGCYGCWGLGVMPLVL